MNPPVMFLDVAPDYRLGDLDTEHPHPGTVRLSDWARHNLPSGIAALREVDRLAASFLAARIRLLDPLRVTIREVIERGDRVFLCGCGATGRLSIALERFARDGLLPGATPDNVIGFMAGGDAALIRAIERFEDLPGHGDRQLRELGFRDGDLLIASTEGGETPFVIGAAEAAADLSREAPFFVYGNPDAQLRRLVARSRRILGDRRVRKVNLSVGPMALSGSTRMQASTVIMAGIGFAMGEEEPCAALARWRSWVLGTLDWSVLQRFIEREAEIAKAGGHVVYEPGPFGITVLTDTTERSPTFALPPFEREGIGEAASACYLHLPGTTSPREAWEHLLGREPRGLEWGDLADLTGSAAMERFDFSDGVPLRREQRTGREQHRFRIDRVPGGIRWRLGEMEETIPVPTGACPFAENLALKLLLNTHSTLVMGRLGRYEDNVMTYVAPNNFKLIDRAVRYSLRLLERCHGVTMTYDTVARHLLSEKEHLHPGEPIVLRTVNACLRDWTSSVGGANPA